MKTVTAILAAVGLLALTPFAATPAFADPAPGTSQGAPDGYCASNIGLFPAETFGNCMGIYATGRIAGTLAGHISQVCSFFMKSRPDDFYAVYDSYSDCILDGAGSL
jgi:hypothetical protein